MPQILQATFRPTLPAHSRPANSRFQSNGLSQQRENLSGLNRQPGKTSRLQITQTRSNRFLPQPLTLNRASNAFQAPPSQANSFSSQQAITRYRSIDNLAELSPNGELVGRLDTRA